MTPHAGAGVGVDGKETARGLERHVVTDTLGLLLVVPVSTAERDDGTTAPKLLAGPWATRFPRMEVLWGGSEYPNDTRVAWLKAQDR